jgi:phosphopantothenoylcysteine decarboxylase/phosphopantothenate--cysteine ligase
VRRLSSVLITAGPTRERIDGVRYISNFSTGNMGYELARASVRRGYKTTLISGPTALTPPAGAKFIAVEDAAGMEKEVARNVKKADCLFMASAVCDWRPARQARGKLKKAGRGIMLRLVRNPDILERVGRNNSGKVIAGFALESGGMVKNAKKKLSRKRLDFIVANRLGGRTPFGPGRTDVTIIDSHGAIERIKAARKGRVARRLLEKAEETWNEKA